MSMILRCQKLAYVASLAIVSQACNSQVPKLGPYVLHTDWDAKVDARYAAIRESTFVLETMSPKDSVREAKRIYEIWQRTQKTEDLFQAAVWCRRVSNNAANEAGIDIISMRLDLYRAISKGVAPKSYYYCREAFLLGRSCLIRQDFQYYKHLLKRDPKDWTVMRHAAMNLLESLEQDYMYAEAIGLYRRIIEEGPAQTDDYFFLGTAYCFRGWAKRSIKDIEESLRILDMTLNTKPPIDTEKYERTKKRRLKYIDIIKKEIAAKAKKGK